MLPDWTEYHRQVMWGFLNELNAKFNTFVLKGGTSLMFFYGLDRFSEDLDFDCTVRSDDILDFVERYAVRLGASYRVAENTDTVKRFMIHYGVDRPLKIEISYRVPYIDASEISSINGIVVYSIDRLLELKVAAYKGRDRIRDLYDISFIYKKYKDVLPQHAIRTLRDAVTYNGVEHADLLLKTQTDSLIDNIQLGNDFLDMCDGLGLL